MKIWQYLSHLSQDFKKISRNNSFMGEKNIHMSQRWRTNINYTTQIINVHYGISSNLHSRDGE